MAIPRQPHGTLKGRSIDEAFAGGAAPAAVKPEQILSPPANGLRTVLQFQEFEGERYVDSACLIRQTDRII
jgi:hypothetical protein